MTLRHTAMAMFVLLTAATGLAHAGWFELALDDETADLWLGAHLGRDPETQFALGGRFLYTDETDGQIASLVAGFASNPKAAKDSDIAFLVQVFGGEGENQDVGAVALGLSGNWAPENLKGVFFGGRLFYAPEIFTYSDTEGLIDWAIKAGYRFTPKMEVFLAYTKFEVDFENFGDVEVDKGLKFGFGARF